MSKVLTRARVMSRTRHLWVVELGSEKRGWLGMSTVWRSYSTPDNGDTWCHGAQYDDGWRLHPEHEMGTIDVCLGALIPHLRQAGDTEQADKLRKRQEAYWAANKEAQKAK